MGWFDWGWKTRMEKEVQRVETKIDLVIRCLDKLISDQITDPTKLAEFTRELKVSQEALKAAIKAAGA